MERREVLLEILVGFQRLCTTHEHSMSGWEGEGKLSITAVIIIQLGGASRRLKPTH